MLQRKTFCKIATIFPWVFIVKALPFHFTKKQQGRGKLFDNVFQTTEGTWVGYTSKTRFSPAELQEAMGKQKSKKFDTNT